LGVFFTKDVPRGTVIWVFHPQFDRVYDNYDAFVNACPSKLILERIGGYAYPSKFTGRYLYTADVAAFVNHTTHEPSAQMISSDRVINKTCFNGADMNEGALITTRDVKAGEEITENYIVDFGPMDLSNPRDSYLL
jgi:hypothetical protein